MKRTKLLKTAPCKAPEISSDENVIAVSQIIRIDGEETLEISLFYQGEVKGRYFADKKVHNAWVDGRWYTCKLENVARICKGLETLNNYYLYFDDVMKWASKEDRQKAEKFLGTWSIDSYEDHLNAIKRDRAIDRKTEKIDQMMAAVPCTPEDMETWIKEEIFPGDILLFKKEKNRTKYSCTACGANSWKKIGWKHGKTTRCPKCGSLVQTNCRQQEKVRSEPVVLLQHYGEEWIERQFKAVCRWRPGEKKIYLYEQVRAIIPKGQCWGEVWYGTKYEADEWEQEYWDTNPLNKRFLTSYLYPGTLNDTLPYGNLEKSGIQIMAAKKEKFNVNEFITTFHQRPYIEYLIKAGLTRLAADIVDIYGWYGDPDIIDQTGRTLQEALQIDGNRVNRLKQMNGGIYILEWLQYEEQEKIKISQESLEWLSKKKFQISYCNEILDGIRSVNKMVNYIKKQTISPTQVVITWNDYMRMAEAEGYDLSDDIVRFPKELKKRHDELVELRNKRNDAEKLKGYRGLDQKIEQRLPEAARYYWENEKYMIIPAGKCQELMEEGRALHHCVGSSDIYMRKMAAGQSWILFLRKKEDLQKPYYTIEIDMEEDKILQYYSEFDRQPDEKRISQLLQQFVRSVKQKKEPVRVRTTAIA